MSPNVLCSTCTINGVQSLTGNVTATQPPPTAEDFARKHAGQLVQGTNNAFKGYVCGYFQDSVGIVIDMATSPPDAIMNHYLPRSFTQTWMAHRGHAAFQYNCTLLRKPNELSIVGVLKPVLVGALLVTAPKDFPNKCPKCGSPAYIGFLNTECSSSKCTNYKASV
jgi:hypothetical protein